MKLNTPLQVSNSGSYWSLWERIDKGEYVGCVHDQEHAAEIIRRVNAFDALLAACKEARRELGCLIRQATARGETSGGPNEVVAIIETAIAAAEKTK